MWDWSKEELIVCGGPCRHCAHDVCVDEPKLIAMCSGGPTPLLPVMHMYNHSDTQHNMHRPALSLTHACSTVCAHTPAHRCVCWWCQTQRSTASG